MLILKGYYVNIISSEMKNKVIILPIIAWKCKERTKWNETSE